LAFARAQQLPRCLREDQQELEELKATLEVQLRKESALFWRLFEVCDAVTYSMHALNTALMDAQTMDSRLRSRRTMFVCVCVCVGACVEVEVGVERGGGAHEWRTRSCS